MRAGLLIGSTLAIVFLVPLAYFALALGYGSVNDKPLWEHLKALEDQSRGDRTLDRGPVLFDADYGWTSVTVLRVPSAPPSVNFSFIVLDRLAEGNEIFAMPRSGPLDLPCAGLDALASAPGMLPDVEAHLRSRCSD